MKQNRYSRALKVLKSTELDEKIQRLNETPTNNMSGVYALNDPGFRVGIPDPPKVYYPDVDGNWPAGIPGTPGELSYTRPEGYWSGGSDWDQQIQTDFSQDYLLEDPTGKSTAGLIADNGTVLAKLPPGGEAFILGPVVDGFVPNHTSDAYTNIGYIQKDTRQFVLLARISGQWKSNLNGSYPVWGGTSTGFTAYNANFTLAMAQWIRDEILADRYSSNVPYFYSGGVPQVPQSAADCPNCPPGMYGGKGVGGAPFGKGGNPSIGTKQGNPKKGNEKDAGFPWELFKKLGKELTDKLKDAFNKGKKGLDDFFKMMGNPEKALEKGMHDFGKELGKLGKNLDPKVMDQMLKQFNKDFNNTFGNGNISEKPQFPPSPGSKDYDAFKAGGGNAALKQGKPLQQVINQGKENISDKMFSQMNPWIKPDNWMKDPIKTFDSLLSDLMLVGPGAGSNALKFTSAINALKAAQAAQGIKKTSEIIDNIPGKFTSAKGSGAPTPPKVQVNGKWVDISDPAANGNWTAKQIWNTKTGKYDIVKNTDPGWDWAQRTLTDPLFKHYTKTGEMPPGLQGWNIPKAFTPTMMQTGPTPLAGAAVKGGIGAAIGASALDAGAAKGQVSQDIINKGNTNPDSLTNKELDAYINYLKTQSPSQSSGAKPQSFDTLNKISPEPAGVDNLINKLTNSKSGSSKESTLKKDAVKMLDKLDPSSPKYDKLLKLLAQSYEPRGKYLLESHTLKSVRSFITEEMPLTPTEPSTVTTAPPVPQPSGSPDYKQQGMTTGEKPTDYSKAQLSFLQKTASDGFITGYLSGYNPTELQSMFKGTNINTSQVNSLITTSKEYWRLNGFYSQEWSRLTQYYSPIRSNLISQMYAASAAKDRSAFDQAYYEINKTWAITDSYMESALQASSAWSKTISALANYIRSGQLNPMDPFKIDDPNVGAEKKQKEEKDKEIQNLIDQLKKASSDSQKAALMNQLKAFGMGALFLAALAAGAAVLFIPAVNMALGPTIVGILSGMLKIGKNVGDDALGKIGAVDDFAAGGLGNVTGQLADDAAATLNKLSKSNLGQSGKTLQNNINQALDDGNAELLKKLLQQADDLLYGKVIPKPQTPPKPKFDPTRIYDPKHPAVTNSYEPQGQVISESRQRILREIKNPVTVEEQPQKLKNYRPNFAGKYTPQNTPDVTASKQSDEMVKAKNAAGQSWRSEDKYWKGYETVERMNIIYDNVGHGSQYWDMIVNENQNKKGWRNREVQEHLNIIAHEKAMIRENPQYESPFQTALKEQETLQADKDPLFKKVAQKLKTQIDYSDKPSKAGYPDEPPPEMLNGFHPQYGQRDNYYNKLDPHSANAMPPTGNPKIDAKVEKARKVKRLRNRV